MVIVVALFIVALVAVISYAMMSRLERDTRRTSLILRNAEAEYYAQGSIAWAMDQLRTNLEQKKPNKLVDNLPMQSRVGNVDGFKIFSTIYDMQARFNINNISTEEAQADFVRLMKAVDAKLPEEKAREIARATFNWLIPLSPENEFNRYYLDQPVPYRAANQAMQNISELRLVKGMQPALFNAIKSYLIALPAATRINVQTASAPVLITLSPTMTLATAQEIVNARAKKPFVNVETFLGLGIVQNHKIKENKITVTSNFFLVATNVSKEKQQLVIYTLLERKEKEGKGSLTILWQSKSMAE